LAESRHLTPTVSMCACVCLPGRRGGVRQGGSYPCRHRQLHQAVQGRAPADRACHSARVPGHRQSAVSGDHVGPRAQVLAMPPRRGFPPAAKDGHARSTAFQIATLRSAALGLLENGIGQSRIFNNNSGCILALCF